MNQQKFIETNNLSWLAMEKFPGTEIMPLAEPVPKGSIHKLKMKAGTIIPVHQHPCDEYVYVLSGIIKTGDRECGEGTFWFTPANIQNGPHQAIVDTEIITIRLGEMGIFSLDISNN